MRNLTFSRIHLRAGALVAAGLMLLSACGGLRPAEEPPIEGADGACVDIDRPAPVALEQGVIVEFSDFGAEHVICEVLYETSPPTSGNHFPTWQNCGFYTEPVRDETAVHAMEHGAIWIAYDPDLDAVRVAEIEAIVGTDPHFLASPYPGLKNPIVVSAWQRQLAVDDVSTDVFAEFVENQLGRVSQTAPEAGVSCAGALGAAPDDPDFGMEQAEDFFMDK